MGWRLTTADRTVELYDPSGRLTSITQSSGVSLALTYDASGRLSTVTDPFGNQVICTYSPESRLMSVQLPGSMSVTYTYDTLGRLTHATYPDTTSRQYHYENVDYNYALTGVTDEAANRYSVFVHDAYGRISETSLAGTVNRFRYTYSNMGSSTSQTSVTVIDPLGTSRIHRFSNVRGVHKQQTNTGTTLCTYPGCESGKDKLFDANGNPSRSSDYRGNRTCYLYDLSRNLETVRLDGLTSTTNCPANLSTYVPAANTRQRKISTTWHATFRQPTLSQSPIVRRLTRTMLAATG